MWPEQLLSGTDCPTGSLFDDDGCEAFPLVPWPKSLTKGCYMNGTTYPSVPESPLWEKLLQCHKNTRQPSQAWGGKTAGLTAAVSLSNRQGQHITRNCWGCSPAGRPAARLSPRECAHPSPYLPTHFPKVKKKKGALKKKTGRSDFILPAWAVDGGSPLTDM